MELQISEMNGDSDPFNISFNDNIWSQFNTQKEEEKPEEDDDDKLMITTTTTTISVGRSAADDGVSE